MISHKSSGKIVKDAGYMEKLRRAAIKVKHGLSDISKEQIIARVEINGRIFSIPVNRSIFDEITSQLLNQTLNLMEDIYDRNIGECDISEIICVGGSSNMLQVEAGLKKRFPKCIVRIYEPEHAVVNGTAIFAAKDLTINDFANFSYGPCSFRDYDPKKKDENQEYIINQIKKGAQLPVKATGAYNPLEDNQKSIKFAIYESDKTDDYFKKEDPDKRKVGQVVLELPPKSKKTLSIKCILSLNKNGLLEVTAYEPSGNKVKAEFHVNAM